MRHLRCLRCDGCRPQPVEHPEWTNEKKKMLDKNETTRPSKTVDKRGQVPTHAVPEVMAWKLAFVASTLANILRLLTVLAFDIWHLAFGIGDGSAVW